MSIYRYGGENQGAPAEELVAMVADFFRIAQTEARARLEAELSRPGSHVAAAWRDRNPSSEVEIIRFYQESPSYVYDLVADHCRSHRRSVLDITMRRIDRYGTPRDVLVYGDGIGTDSMELARRGHRVTYFDLPGITSQFARFRFERGGLAGQIRVLESTKEMPCEAFDAVVCIEVLEHLTDPIGALREIYMALRRGGIALITESFETVGHAYPSHLVQNVKYAGLIHRLMEDLGFANTYYNTDPVNRPMEFMKAPGILGGLLRHGFRMRRAAECRVRRWVLNRM